MQYTTPLLTSHPPLSPVSPITSTPVTTAINIIAPARFPDPVPSTRSLDGKEPPYAKKGSNDELALPIITLVKVYAREKEERRGSYQGDYRGRKQKQKPGDQPADPSVIVWPSPYRFRRFFAALTPPSEGRTGKVTAREPKLTMPHADPRRQQPTPDDGPCRTHRMPYDRPKGYDRDALSDRSRGGTSRGRVSCPSAWLSGDRSRPARLTFAPASAIVAI